MSIHLIYKRQDNKRGNKNEKIRNKDTYRLRLETGINTTIKQNTKYPTIQKPRHNDILRFLRNQRGIMEIRNRESVLMDALI